LPFPNAKPKAGYQEPAFPRGSLVEHMAHSDAGEEESEDSLLEEAAKALEASGTAADLVAKIRSFLATHEQPGEGPDATPDA
jgi:hypothetical protein